MAMLFVSGLIIGVAMGVMVLGFLAIQAYNRGYEDAFGRRKVWRAELTARRTAVQQPAAAARRAS